MIPRDRPTRILTYPTVLRPRYRVALVFIVAVTVVAGILDSLALAMFVPLAELIVNKDGVPTDNFLIRSASTIFDWFGLQFSLRWTIVAIVMTQALRAAGLLVQSWFMAHFKARYERQEREITYRTLLLARWEFFLRRRTGDLVNVIDVQIGRASGALNMYMNIAASFITVAVYLGAAFLISWSFTAIAVAVAAATLLSLNFLVHYARKLGERSTTASLNMSAETTDVLSNVRTVKSGALEDVAVARFSGLARTFETTDVKSGLNQGLLLSASELAFLIALFGTMLIGLRVLTVPPSALLLFALLFFRMFQRLRMLQGQLQSFNQTLPAVDVVRTLNSEGRSLAERSNGNRFTRLQEEVRLDHVSFEYPGRDPVLRDVTLRIPKGSTVALVGSSGVGKTTVIDLVNGFHTPTRGTVLVDGQPLEGYDLRSWRARISYVAQDAALFHGSVRDNVAWADPSIDDLKIHWALDQACAADFVGNLKDGINTQLGERGATLSGGQRQRIALARALLRQPDLLILDEATNELDQATEKRFFDRLADTPERRTVLIVAHRLSSLMSADIVYVLDGGKVVESGPPSRLIEDQGHFYRLAGIGRT